MYKRYSLTKPFKRGQAANGDGAQQEPKGGVRHLLRKAAEAVDVARTRGMHDGARAEEEKGLEEAMVPYVKKRATDAEDHELR